MKRYSLGTLPSGTLGRIGSKTDPWQGFMAALRLYGATMPVYDQSWIADDT
jgi:hypothetical protein